ncbi:hypothetical protein U9M48_005394 [Paspalum notatum var. saurae]|uniref:Uncharacterized protein n=1 Tax=Paspalum notatum var. saurae TaxID=547442 RepID=A0AAQ3PMA3_PASNO
MAKIILLVSLLLYIIVAEAVPLPAAEWSAAAEKSIEAMKSKLTKALEGVVLAAPPAKRPEVQKATLEHMAAITALLAEAHATGDEKKAIKIASSYEKAAELVIGAPSDQKFDAMQTTFSVALTPDPTKCPTVDKYFCEAYAKLKKAQNEVISSAPPAKATEIKDAVLSQGFAAGEAISKAYATGEEKKIAAVIIAYCKAADAVIAAPPAEKFKVLEETFTAANKA